MIEALREAMAVLAWTWPDLPAGRASWGWVAGMIWTEVKGWMNRRERQ